MAIIEIEGRRVVVSPNVRIDWGPDEEYVREQTPLEKILFEEKIALNAHMAWWKVRNSALEEIEELNEIIENADDEF